MKRLIAVAAIVATSFAGVALATPGHGISAEVIATKTVQHLSIQADDPTTALVVRVTLEPGGTSGWHSHPATLAVAVRSGEITLVSDSCTRRTLHAGEMFLERPGVVHRIVNNGSSDTVLIATILGLPAGASPTTDEPNPCD
jgi:quercetin dioxygenase-like cupin family protein